MIGDFYELNAMIFHTKSTVYLEHDIEYFEKGRIRKINNGFKDGINISKNNIIIEGNNHTIDAKNQVRIFNITGKNVTIKNITFKNGYTDGFGGAICNKKGQIKLINCKFVDNTAEENGNDIYNAPESFINLDYYEFTKNNPKNPIWNYGNIIINDSQHNKLHNLISGGNIRFQYNTFISVEKINTKKFVNETHDLTIKLTNSEDYGLFNKKIKLSNGMVGITNENGLVTFNISFDKSGVTTLTIFYEGEEENNIIYNASQEVSVDFITLNKNKSEQPYLDQFEANENIDTTGHIINSPFEAYTGDGQYIFISYAHPDWKGVFKELKRFNREYNIWYDEGILSGTNWDDYIADKLDTCSLFVVFITSNSVASPNVKNEISYAFSEKKPIIPIYLAETTLIKGLKLRLNDTQSILKYAMDEKQYTSKYHRDFEKYIKIKNNS